MRSQQLEFYVLWERKLLLSLNIASYVRVRLYLISFIHR